MVQRIFLQHDPSKNDFRCDICKQHKYLIKDHQENITAIHSSIDLPLGDTGAKTWIHWWSAPTNDMWVRSYNNYDTSEGKCLQYYKEVIL